MVTTYKLFILDFDHQFDNIGLSNRDLMFDMSSNKGLMVITEETTTMSSDKNRYIRHSFEQGWKIIDL